MLKKSVWLGLLVIVALTCHFNVQAKEPVKIIYDTDMGNDIDDVFALAMLNNLQKRGEIDFLAKKDGKTNYIQVTYELDGNSDAIEREFGAFSYISDDNSKYVISMDKKDLSRDGIVHLNLIDFLLGDNL